MGPGWRASVRFEFSIRAAMSNVRFRSAKRIKSCDAKEVSRTQLGGSHTHRRGTAPDRVGYPGANVS